MCAIASRRAIVSIHWGAVVIAFCTAVVVGRAFTAIVFFMVGRIGCVGAIVMLIVMLIVIFIVFVVFVIVVLFRVRSPDWCSRACRWRRCWLWLGCWCWLRCWCSLGYGWLVGFGCGLRYLERWCWFWWTSGDEGCEVVAES